MNDNKAVENSNEKNLEEGGGKSFVHKLYDIVQNPDNKESGPRSIWWTPDGQGILVSPKGFDQHDSKKYFQGTRYFGFSRRLMRNYFDRISDSECFGVHEYRHRDGMFKKDRPDLLNNIKFNNKRPYRKEAEKKPPPSKSSPRIKRASPQPASHVQCAETKEESSVVPARSGVQLSLPYLSDLATFQAGASIPRQLSLQLINLSQSSFLQHQAMRQAEEERRELLSALQSQRSRVNVGQSVDQFVLYQLLQEEAQQQQLQNSLLRIPLQLPAHMTRDTNPPIPANLAPSARSVGPAGQSTENEALERYILDLLRFRPGGV